MSNRYGIFPKWFKQPVCLLNIFVEASFENSEIVASQQLFFFLHHFHKHIKVSNPLSEE